MKNIITHFAELKNYSKVQSKPTNPIIPPQWNSKFAKASWTIISGSRQSRPELTPPRSRVILKGVAMSFETGTLTIQVSDVALYPGRSSVTSMQIHRKRREYQPGRLKLPRKQADGSTGKSRNRKKMLKPRQNAGNIPWQEPPSFALANQFFAYGSILPLMEIHFLQWKLPRYYINLTELRVGNCGKLSRNWHK